MKLTAREVESRLRNPDPSVRAWLIYGPDRGLVRERADGLAKSLLEDPTDPFAVSQLTEDDIKADPAALADAMAAMSLTGGARLVRLRLSGEAAAGPLIEFVKSLDAGDAGAEAVLIAEAGDLQARGRLRKTIEPSKSMLAAPCYADSAASLGDMADEMFRAEGLQLTPEARAALLPRLEGDRALARGEVEKLILYKGLAGQRPEGEGSVGIEDIEAVSSGQGDAALDAIIGPALAGEQSKADNAYARAIDGGASAVGVLRALQRRIDQIGAWHAAGGNDQVLARIGAPRFGPAQTEFKRQAGLWRGKALDRARSLAFDAERQVKRSGAPADALVGELVLRLSRGAAQMAARRR